MLFNRRLHRRQSRNRAFDFFSRRSTVIFLVLGPLMCGFPYDRLSSCIPSSASVEGAMMLSCKVCCRVLLLLCATPTHTSAHLTLIPTLSYCCKPGVEPRPVELSSLSRKGGKRRACRGHSYYMFERHSRRKKRGVCIGFGFRRQSTTQLAQDHRLQLAAAPHGAAPHTYNSVTFPDTIASRAQPNVCFLHLFPRRAAIPPSSLSLPPRPYPLPSARACQRPTQ